MMMGLAMMLRLQQSWKFINGSNTSKSAVCARKKPKTATTKTTTPPEERKGPTTAAPVATYATRPAAPPPLRRDERIDGSGAPPLGSRFAAKTVHRPTPYPHPFLEFPNPPDNEPSEAVDDASLLSRSNGMLAYDGLASTTLQGREVVADRRSPTATSSERPRVAPHSPRRPAQTIAADVPTSDIAAGSNFPEILYEIISDPSDCHIVSWLSHGLGFAIHDRQLFASQILPRYFDGAKYTSFTRRLKRWKFVRVPRGPEMGAYYNKHFMRGRSDLVRGMVYRMDDDGGGTKEEDGQSNEKSVKEKQQRKDEEKKEEDRRSQVASLDDDGACNDAAFATVMEVHQWQQQRQLKRGMDEEIAVPDDEERDGQIRKKKRKGTRDNEKNKPETSGAAYDAAVVEAAMEVHRQLQWQLGPSLT